MIRWHLIAVLGWASDVLGGWADSLLPRIGQVEHESDFNGDCFCNECRSYS